MARETVATIHATPVSVVATSPSKDSTYATSATSHRQAPVTSGTPRLARAVLLTTTRTTSASRIASARGYAAETTRTSGGRLESVRIDCREKLQHSSTLTATMVSRSRVKPRSTRAPARPGPRASTIHSAAHRAA